MKKVILFIGFIVFCSSLLLSQYDSLLYNLPIETSCSIETYDSSNQAVHPDILYYRNSFLNNYFYMAMTPYPGGLSSYENPSIVVSQDGVNFFEEEDSINPIVPKPPGNSWNCDPDIIYYEESEEFFIYYLETLNGKTKNNVNLLRSNDGITWEDVPKNLINYIQQNGSQFANPFIVSPAIIKKDNNYYMFYVHLIDPHKNSDSGGVETIWDSSYVQYLISSDGLTWDKNDTHQIFIDSPDNFFPWHLDIFNGNDGYYYMLCNGGEGDAGSWTNHNLYIARSEDLVNWTDLSLIIPDTDSFFNKKCKGVYRSTGLINKEMDLLVVWFSWTTFDPIWSVGMKKFELSSIEAFRPEVLNIPSEYPTIQSAIDSSNHGDTILVSPGIYFESINYNGKNIIIKSTDGPHNTTITYNSSTDLVIFENNETYAAVLDGFTLEGGKKAIWCKNSAPIIRNNILKDQNVVDWAAIALSGENYASIGESPAYIINNTIINSANGGISTFSTVAPIIKNNIIVDCIYGIHKESSSSVETPIIDYNNVWDCTNLYINILNSGQNSINMDPIFTEYFSLYAGSPCIDAGVPDSYFYDIDGTINDIGAVATYQVQDNIQEAINIVENHDVVLINSGVYSIEEPIYVNGKDIILMSSDYYNRATITTNNSLLDLIIFDDSISQDAELRNLKLVGGFKAVWCKNSAPTIIGNLFLNQNVNNWAAISLSGENYASVGTSPAHIINNTIVNSNNGGISSFSNEAPNIRNNIIIDCNYGVHLYNQNAPISIDYNDIWNCSNLYINIDSIGNGSISCNPLLDEFYYLIDSSPCIDTGDPNPIYNDPDGSRNDMGWMPYYSRMENLNIEEEKEIIRIYSNQPNPFKSFTNINFYIPTPMNVNIKIYDLSGRVINNLIDGIYESGDHRIKWEGIDNSGNKVMNGIYIYKIIIGNNIYTNKMLVIE